MANQKTNTNRHGLSASEKRAMVRSHEDGSTVYELADEYGITPRSVAAYVANAHRGRTFPARTTRIYGNPVPAAPVPVNETVADAFRRFIKANLGESNGRDMLVVFSAPEGGAASTVVEAYDDITGAYSFNVPGVVAKKLGELAGGSTFTFCIDLDLFKSGDIEL